MLTCIFTAVADSGTWTQWLFLSPHPPHTRTPEASISLFNILCVWGRLDMSVTSLRISTDLTGFVSPNLTQRP